MSGPGWRPSAWLLTSAAGRLQATHPDWARAMIAEADSCASGADRLGWAWGCWIASLRTTYRGALLAYCAALPAGLWLLGHHEWHADESRATVALLGLIALALGVLRPRLALLSGGLVGLVVAAMIGFEALSGIRPAYEARAQTLGHSLYWLILLVPSLSLAALGARIGRWLRLGEKRG